MAPPTPMPMPVPVEPGLPVTPLVLAAARVQSLKRKLRTPSVSSMKLVSRKVSPGTAKLWNVVRGSATTGLASGNTHGYSRWAPTLMVPKASMVAPSWTVALTVGLKTSMVTAKAAATLGSLVAVKEASLLSWVVCVMAALTFTPPPDSRFAVLPTTAWTLFWATCSTSEPAADHGGAVWLEPGTLPLTFWPGDWLTAGLLAFPGARLAAPALLFAADSLL